MLSSGSSASRVYIVIVNWNGWEDTIECLESLHRLDYPDYRVIVCDNGSEDHSLEQIREWAEGRIRCGVSDENSLKALSHPPVPKPVPYVQYDRRRAEAGGEPSDEACRLILVDNEANLGFAGGTNVGLRYALARDDFGYVWLLNNDTVVEPDALNRLVERMGEAPKAGMCGSTVLYYHNPDVVQALGGGRYSRMLGLTRHIGLFGRAKEPIDAARAERTMSYVVAASMLVRKSFLIDIGLMCEDYFLYYEELDWAMRARGRYELAYAPKSTVYHKEGGATGASNARPGEKSLTSDFFLIRSRMMLTRKFSPWALPTVYLGLSITLARRLRARGWWARLRSIFAAALGFTHNKQVDDPDASQPDNLHNSKDNGSKEQ